LKNLKFFLDKEVKLCYTIIGGEVEILSDLNKLKEFKMAIDIAKMKAKLEASKNPKSGKQDGTKWRPSEGDQTLRIITTADGDPFKEFHFHYNVGKNPGILCPKKNHGEDCPICEFASSLWREGMNNNDDNAKREAKKLFVRKRYFSPILVRGEEEKGVRIWSYGKMAYETLLGLVLDPDYGDITDPETGTDIVLTYTVPGTPGSFPKSQIKPRRRPSVLCDEAIADCQELIDSIPDISSIFTRLSTEEVQTILDESFSTDTSSERSSSETEKYSGKDKVQTAFEKLMG
jgi:hypothetical protein